MATYQGNGTGLEARGGFYRLVAWVQQHKKYIAVTAIAFLLAGVAGLNLYRLAHPPGVEVEVAEVKRGSIKATINASGRVVAADREVLVAVVGGQVEEVMVKRGEKTIPGEVLLKINDEVLALKVREAEAALAAAEASAARSAGAAGESELIQAEAAFQQAEASLASAREREKDFKELYEAGVASASEYEAACLERELKQRQYEAAARQLAAAREALVSTRQGARAQVEQARASLELARYQLEHAVVRTKRGGQVLQLNVRPGDVVSAGQVLAVVGNRERLEIEAEINEADAGFIQVGQLVEVSSSTLQKWSCQGYVREVAPQAVSKIKGQSEQMVIPVVIELDSSSLESSTSGVPGGLFPGASVDLGIVVGQAEAALLVPFDALVEREGQKLVLVVENNVARERQVETGLEDADAGRVQILNGLEEGDVVIVNPPEELKEGTPVKFKLTSVS